MTTLREAAQQALEMLESLQGCCTDSDDGTIEAMTVWCPEVIDDLRAALAEPVQEPVAWMVYTEGGTSAYITDNPNDLVGAYRALPLYTAPHRRKPLTDEEIHDCFHAARNAKLGASNDNSKHRLSVVEIARAIEAAHGIGSTT